MAERPHLDLDNYLPYLINRVGVAIAENTITNITRAAIVNADVSRTGAGNLTLSATSTSSIDATAVARLEGAELVNRFFEGKAKDGAYLKEMKRRADEAARGDGNDQAGRREPSTINEGGGRDRDRCCRFAVVATSDFLRQDQPLLG